MAIRKIIKQSTLSSRERDLIEILKSEIKRPAHKASPSDAPVIMAEEGLFPKTVRYFVVWDRFRGLDGEARYRVIFHALVEALGPRKTANATVMEGFTRNEALQMGLKYEVGQD